MHIFFSNNIVSRDRNKINANYSIRYPSIRFLLGSSKESGGMTEEEKVSELQDSSHMQEEQENMMKVWKESEQDE